MHHKGKLYFLLSLLIFLKLLSSSLTDSSESGCYGLAESHQDKVHCKPSTLSGLSFCSEMNGKITDDGFNTLEFTVSSGQTTLTSTYAQVMDKLLQQVFSDLKTYLSDTQQNRGGQVCESCFSKLKTLVCANTFPASGMHSCIVNNVMGRLSSIDKKCGTSLCGCPENGLCSVDQSGGYCSLKSPPTDWKKLLCLFTKLPDVPSSVKKCHKYFTPLSQCIDTMSSCGCLDSSQVKSMCSQIFLPDGILEVDLPSGDCQNTTGWCQSPSINSSTSTTESGVVSRLLNRFSVSHISNRILSSMFKDQLKLNNHFAVQDTAVGTVTGQLVCPNPNLCISTPAPLTTPSLVGLAKLTKTSQQVDSSTTSEFTKNMACSGADDTNCPRGCAKSQALAYDPSVRIDDGSCDRDPLVLMTWGQRNLPWMIAVFVIVVVFILLVIIVGILSCFFCCCKTALCCCCAPAKAIL